MTDLFTNSKYTNRVGLVSLVKQVLYELFILLDWADRDNSCQFPPLTTNQPPKTAAPTGPEIPPADLPAAARDSAGHLGSSGSPLHHTGRDLARNPGGNISSVWSHSDPAWFLCSPYQARADHSLQTGHRQAVLCPAHPVGQVQEPAGLPGDPEQCLCLDIRGW